MPPASRLPASSPARAAAAAASTGAAPESRPAPPPCRGRTATSGSSPSSRAARRRRSSFWKELPLLIVVALVLTFLIQTFLAKVYVIPSGSMETTLHGCAGCNNDRVLVDKITYRFSDPAPGDVVVFRGPDSWSSEFIVEQPSNALVRGLQLLGSLIGLAPPDEKDFVKRVIAVGGQTVQCCDSDNRVMVDGQPLDEPYSTTCRRPDPARQNAFGPVTVPAGQLWMMGDSRNNSADSRVADHGPVPVDERDRQGADDRAAVRPVRRSVDRPAGHGVGPARPGPLTGAPVALGLLGRCRWPDAGVAASIPGCLPAACDADEPLARVRPLSPTGSRPPMPAPAGCRGRRPAAPRCRPSSARRGRSCAARGNWTLQTTLDRYGLGPVAGVDEAGRGACAGPLVVAACVLRPGDAKRLDGLTDSKLLTPAAREEYFALLLRRAVDHAVVVVGPEEVDRRGVHVANIEGMRRAVARLRARPGYVLTDGFPVRGFGSPALAVPKGDQIAACVAAASVLAKVTRDRIMVGLDRRVPGVRLRRAQGLLHAGARRAR